MNNLLPQPLYEPRSTHTPHTQTSKAGGNSVEHQVLWWSQHRGNAQHTFRTWKLSPAAPMVLQPIGCGRVGHRHNTPNGSGQKPEGFWPLPLFTHPDPDTPTHTRRTTNPFTLPRSCGETSSLMMEQLPGPCGTSGNLCPNQYRFVLHSYARTIHAALPHRAFPGPHAQACTRG